MVKANRSLSQNFMKNLSVIAKVKEIISSEETGSILEIGPGNGEFTDMLFDACSEVLSLVEKDDNLAVLLRDRYSPKGVRVFNEDARGYEITQSTVFSSMPYSISKELTKKIVLSPSVRYAYLIVQKEFGEKMERGNMSALSLFARTFFIVRKEFNISRGSFSPAPNVDSCFISMKRIAAADFRCEDYWDYLNMLTSNRLKKASFITGKEDGRRIGELSLPEIIAIYADKYIQAH